MDFKGYITIVKKSGEDGTEYPVRQNDQCAIGSGIGCQIRLIEKTVDKKVCIINTQKAKAELQCISENTPVLINGSPCKGKKTLKNDDLIIINDKTLRWKSPSSKTKVISTKIRRRTSYGTNSKKLSPKRKSWDGKLPSTSGSTTSMKSRKSGAKSASAKKRESKKFPTPQTHKRKYFDTETVVERNTLPKKKYFATPQKQLPASKLPLFQKTAIPIARLGTPKVVIVKRTPAKETKTSGTKTPKSEPTKTKTPKSTKTSKTPKSEMKSKTPKLTKQGTPKIKPLIIVTKFTPKDKSAKKIKDKTPKATAVTKKSPQSKRKSLKLVTPKSKEKTPKTATKSLKLEKTPLNKQTTPKTTSSLKKNIATLPSKELKKVVGKVTPKSVSKSLKLDKTPQTKQKTPKNVSSLKKNLASLTPKEFETNAVKVTPKSVKKSLNLDKTPQSKRKTPKGASALKKNLVIPTSKESARKSLKLNKTPLTKGTSPKITSSKKKTPRKMEVDLPKSSKKLFEKILSAKKNVASPVKTPRNVGKPKTPASSQKSLFEDSTFSANLDSTRDDGVRTPDNFMLKPLATPQSIKQIKSAVKKDASMRKSLSKSYNKRKISDITDDHINKKIKLSEDQYMAFEGEFADSTPTISISARKALTEPKRKINSAKKLNLTVGYIDVSLMSNRSTPRKSLSKSTVHFEGLSPVSKREDFESSFNSVHETQNLSGIEVIHHESDNELSFVNEKITNISTKSKNKSILKDASTRSQKILNFSITSPNKSVREFQGLNMSAKKSPKPRAKTSISLIDFSSPQVPQGKKMPSPKKSISLIDFSSPEKNNRRSRSSSPKKSKDESRKSSPAKTRLDQSLKSRKSSPTKSFMTQNVSQVKEMNKSLNKSKSRNSSPPKSRKSSPFKSNLDKSTKSRKSSLSKSFVGQNTSQIENMNVSLDNSTRSRKSSPTKLNTLRKSSPSKSFMGLNASQIEEMNASLDNSTRSRKSSTTKLTKSRRSSPSKSFVGRNVSQFEEMNDTLNKSTKSRISSPTKSFVAQNVSRIEEMNKNLNKSTKLRKSSPSKSFVAQVRKLNASLNKSRRSMPTKIFGAQNVSKIMDTSLNKSTKSRKSSPTKSFITQNESILSPNLDKSTGRESSVSKLYVVKQVDITNGSNLNKSANSRKSMSFIFSPNVIIGQSSAKKPGRPRKLETTTTLDRSETKEVRRSRSAGFNRSQELNQSTQFVGDGSAKKRGRPRKSEVDTTFDTSKMNRSRSAELNRSQELINQNASVGNESAKKKGRPRKSEANITLDRSQTKEIRRSRSAGFNSSLELDQSIGFVGEGSATKKGRPRKSEVDTIFDTSKTNSFRSAGLNKSRESINQSNSLGDESAKKKGRPRKSEANTTLDRSETKEVRRSRSAGFNESQKFNQSLESVGDESVKKRGRPRKSNVNTTFDTSKSNRSRSAEFDRSQELNQTNRSRRSLGDVSSFIDSSVVQNESVKSRKSNQNKSRVSLNESRKSIVDVSALVRSPNKSLNVFTNQNESLVLLNESNGTKSITTYKSIISRPNLLNALEANDINVSQLTNKSSRSAILSPKTFYSAKSGSSRSVSLIDVSSPPKTKLSQNLTETPEALRALNISKRKSVRTPVQTHVVLSDKYENVTPTSEQKNRSTRNPKRFSVQFNASQNRLSIADIAEEAEKSTRRSKSLDNLPKRKLRVSKELSNFGTSQLFKESNTSGRKSKRFSRNETGTQYNDFGDTIEIIDLDSSGKSKRYSRNSTIVLNDTTHSAISNTSTKSKRFSTNQDSLIVIDTDDSFASEKSSKKTSVRSSKSKKEMGKVPYTSDVFDNSDAEKNFSTYVNISSVGNVSDFDYYTPQNSIRSRKLKSQNTVNYTGVDNLFDATQNKSRRSRSLILNKMSDTFGADLKKTPEIISNEMDNSGFSDSLVSETGRKSIVTSTPAVKVGKMVPKSSVKKKDLRHLAIEKSIRKSQLLNQSENLFYTPDTSKSSTKKLSRVNESKEKSTNKNVSKRSTKIGLSQLFNENSTRKSTRNVQNETFDVKSAKKANVRKSTRDIFERTDVRLSALFAENEKNKTPNVSGVLKENVNAKKKGRKSKVDMSEISELGLANLFNKDKTVKNLSKSRLSRTGNIDTSANSKLGLSVLFDQENAFNQTRKNGTFANNNLETSKNASRTSKRFSNLGLSTLFNEENLSPKPRLSNPGSPKNVTLKREERVSKIETVTSPYALDVLFDRLKKGDNSSSEEYHIIEKAKASPARTYERRSKSASPHKPAARISATVKDWVEEQQNLSKQNLLEDVPAVNGRESSSTSKKSPKKQGFTPQISKPLEVHVVEAPARSTRQNKQENETVEEKPKSRKRSAQVEEIKVPAKMKKPTPKHTRSRKESITEAIGEGTSQVVQKNTRGKKAKDTEPQKATSRRGQQKVVEEVEKPTKTRGRKAAEVEAVIETPKKATKATRSKKELAEIPIFEEPKRTRGKKVEETPKVEDPKKTRGKKVEETPKVEEIPVIEEPKRTRGKKVEATPIIEEPKKSARGKKTEATPVAEISKKTTRGRKAVTETSKIEEAITPVVKELKKTTRGRKAIEETPIEEPKKSTRGKKVAETHEVEKPKKSTRGKKAEETPIVEESKKATRGRKTVETPKVEEEKPKKATRGKKVVEKVEEAEVEEPKPTRGRRGAKAEVETLHIEEETKPRKGMKAIEPVEVPVKTGRGKKVAEETPKLEKKSTRSKKEELIQETSTRGRNQKGVVPEIIEEEEDKQSKTRKRKADKENEEPIVEPKRRAHSKKEVDVKVSAQPKRTRKAKIGEDSHLETPTKRGGKRTEPYESENKTSTRSKKDVPKEELVSEVTVKRTRKLVTADKNKMEVETVELVELTAKSTRSTRRKK